MCVTVTIQKITNLRVLEGMREVEERRHGRSWRENKDREVSNYVLIFNKNLEELFLTEIKERRRAHQALNKL